MTGSIRWFDVNFFHTVDYCIFFPFDITSLVGFVRVAFVYQ